MGYQDIDNLYKNADILSFRECYALEKIHGTSTRVSYKDGRVSFFAGWANNNEFTAIFDKDTLLSRFTELDKGHSIIVYGEAYGGKLQGMGTKGYGKTLRFVAFEVRIGNNWLAVPQAEDVAKKLGLDFVPYIKCSTKIEDLDFERDRPSEQAKKLGEGDNWAREGIVIRPLIEVTKNNGERIIAKYKGAAFSEVKTKRKVSPEQIKEIQEAFQKAEEWVTLNRLKNILSHIPEPHTIQITGDIIRLMIDDVEREGRDEIVLTKTLKTKIGQQTAQLYKEYLNSALVEAL